GEVLRILVDRDLLWQLGSDADDVTRDRVNGGVGVRLKRQINSWIGAHAGDRAADGGVGPRTEGRRVGRAGHPAAAGDAGDEALPTNGMARGAHVVRALTDRRSS